MSSKHRTPREPCGIDSGSYKHWVLPGPKPISSATHSYPQLALPEKSLVKVLLCAASVFSVSLWLFFLRNS